MTVAVNNVQRNRILNAMTNADLCLLLPHLEAVPLKFRQRLQAPHRSIETVYFPQVGLVSVVVIGGERRQVEVAVVGREGMTGPERLARRLLMARDRLDEDQMPLTHECLALMLGVRRAGVTGALQDFEYKGLVATARGMVSIRDREGLEQCANGLYGPPETEYERLFG